MDYVEWLKEEIKRLNNDAEDDFTYGMLEAFEICLEKYEEGDSE